MENFQIAPTVFVYFSKLHRGLERQAKILKWKMKLDMKNETRTSELVIFILFQSLIKIRIIVKLRSENSVLVTRHDDDNDNDVDGFWI